MKSTTGDIFVGLVSMAASIAVLVSLPGDIANVGLSDFANMSSPAFFPLLAGTAVLLSSLSLLITTIIRRRKALVDDALLAPIGWRPFAMGGACVIYIFLIHGLGMMTASAAVMLVLPLIFDFKKYQWIAPLALVLPFAVYVLFEMVLKVLFPHGALF
jgi:heme exporter protein D